MKGTTNFMEDGIKRPASFGENNQSIYILGTIKIPKQMFIM